MDSRLTLRRPWKGWGHFAIYSPSPPWLALQTGEVRRVASPKGQEAAGLVVALLHRRGCEVGSEEEESGCLILCPSGR